MRSLGTSGEGEQRSTGDSNGSVEKSQQIKELLSHVPLVVTPWIAAHQAPLSSAISRSLLKFISIESVMLSLSFSAIPFSFCLQSFSAFESFPMNQLFASGDQSIEASAAATVLPMNIQD